MRQNGAVSNPTPSAGVSFAVFALLWVSMVLSIGLWVVRDARARGSGRPKLWALASVFTPIGLPYYLYRRHRRAGLGDRAAPPTTVDRLAATWAAASLAAFFGGSLFAPPDPFSLLVYTLAFFVPALLAAYVLVYRGGYRVAAERVGL